MSCRVVSCRVVSCRVMWHDRLGRGDALSSVFFFSSLFLLILAGLKQPFGFCSGSFYSTTRYGTALRRGAVSSVRAAFYDILCFSRVAFEVRRDRPPAPLSSVASALTPALPTSRFATLSPRGATRYFRLCARRSKGRGWRYWERS